MNDTEKRVKEKLQEQGWKVYRNGWPDFAALKNGTLRFIEVKSLYGTTLGRISEEQKEMFLLLEKLTGVKVEIFPEETRSIDYMRALRRKQKASARILKRKIKIQEAQERRKLKAAVAIAKREAAFKLKSFS